MSEDRKTKQEEEVNVDFGTPDEFSGNYAPGEAPSGPEDEMGPGPLDKERLGDGEAESSTDEGFEPTGPDGSS